MFFDDHATCRKIKDLRGLQCAACVSAAGGDAEGVEQDHSLKQLKAHLRERHQLFHCGVCLEGRKVFVSQQLRYTKSQLERHMRGGAGEVDEPLGGFAGHPWCQFCRKHFYDEGQIYHHMQSAHETCHLCRRAQPDKYTYYRDYAELEAHYRSAHHACLHPECLAKKFVVFNTPNELKNHEALEHGRAMTKAERKEALRVHVDFNVGGGAGTGTSAGEGFGAGASGGRRHRMARASTRRIALAPPRWNARRLPSREGTSAPRNRRNSKLYCARPRARRRETCRARRPWMSSRTSAAAAPHAAEVSSEADGRVAAAEEIDAAAEAERPAET